MSDDEAVRQPEPPDTGVPDVDLTCPCGTPMEEGKIGGYYCPRCGLKAGLTVEVTNRRNGSDDA